MVSISLYLLLSEFDVGFGFIGGMIGYSSCDNLHILGTVLGLSRCSTDVGRRGIPTP